MGVVTKNRFISVDDNRDIKAIIYDSRKVKPGSLFVAIPGQFYDGGKSL